MERVIKFRAWNWWNKDHSKLNVGNIADGTYGFMLFPHEIDFKQKRISGSKQEDSYYSGQTWDALMQFTGLLDKNGKEIWEGDIYETKIADRFGGKDIVKIPDIYRLANSIRVIGNIYENPDLFSPKEKR